MIGDRLSLRVGLVGFGRQMQAEYLPALRRLDASVDFICDTDQSRLDIGCRITESVGYSSIETLPDNADENIVVLVALPHHEYKTAIPKLVRRGYKLILMEKPAALGEREFVEVRDRVREQRAHVYIASKRRFYRSYESISALLRSGVHPRRMCFTLGRVFRPSEFGWRTQGHNAHAAVFSDLGYHALDLAIWMNGNPAGWRADMLPRVDLDAVSQLRASVEVSAKNWPCPVEIFLDRVAPSPFEQLVVVCDEITIVGTPRSIHLLDRGGKPLRSNHDRTFAVGDEVDRILECVVGRRHSLLNRAPSLYSEHFWHVVIAEALASLQDRGQRADRIVS